LRPKAKRLTQNLIDEIEKRYVDQGEDDEEILSEDEDSMDED
jgi:hypothetical protein